MKITISQKLRPFSHRPGVACLIPGTCLSVEAFPTLLRFAGFEYPIDVKGPIKNFTLIQDLERNCVFISGDGKDRSYRFRLQAFNGGFELFSQKPKEKKIFAFSLSFFLPLTWEKLSLGSHKSQDWDLVMRRSDLKEILPVIFGLGQKIPLMNKQPSGSILSLLNEAQLQDFCSVAFSDILVPREKDEQHLGLVPSDEKFEGRPFILLQEAFLLIRSLFFRQNERRLEFLPSTLFASGRLINLQVPGVGEIDMEWASYRLRRVVIRANCSGELLFTFPQDVSCFRFTVSKSLKHKKHLVGDPFLVKMGYTYFLDRFQK